MCRIIFILLMSIQISFTACKNEGGSSNQLVIDSLAIGSTHLHYEFLPKETAETLVLIHQGMFDASVWKFQIDHFSNDFQILIYDMPAHGRSGSRIKDYKEHEYLQDLLDHLQIGKCHIAALSFGSIVAVEFALENPARVDKLILGSVGINGVIPSDVEYVKHVNAYINNIQLNKLQEAAQNLARISLTGPNRELEEIDAEIVSFTLEKIENHLAKGFWKEAPNFTQPPSRVRLKEIKQPVLLIHGEADYDYIKGNINEMAAAFDNVQIKTLASVAHMVNYEDPKQFNRVMDEFLEDN